VVKGHVRGPARVRRLRAGARADPAEFAAAGASCPTDAAREARSRDGLAKSGRTSSAGGAGDRAGGQDTVQDVSGSMPTMHEPPGQQGSNTAMLSSSKPTSRSDSPLRASRSALVADDRPVFRRR